MESVECVSEGFVQLFGLKGETYHKVSIDLLAPLNWGYFPPEHRSPVESRKHSHRWAIETEISDSTTRLFHLYKPPASGLVPSWVAVCGIACRSCPPGSWDVFLHEHFNVTLQCRSLFHLGEILDSQSQVVGRATPHDHLKELDQSLPDFVFVSKSQYLGDEKRVDMPGFPLYSVMMMDYDAGRP